MHYGLMDNEWEQMQRLFSSNSKIEKAILYGSRAKGNHKEFSDVDITLTGEGLSQTDLIRLHTLFSDSSLPYIFDLSIFSKIKNLQLIDHIERRGIVIYQRSV